MCCTASKLDTVWHYKERRRLMKEAVFARHHLAAAHDDYLRSLRLTGSALVSYAGGKPLSAAAAATEAEVEREEVQSRYSGDYYSPRSSFKEEEGMRGEDGDLRSETETSINFSWPISPPPPPCHPPPPPKAAEAEDMGAVTAKSEVAGSSAASCGTGEIQLDKMKEIVNAIAKNFNKVATADCRVLEMLEIRPGHLDRSCRQPQQTVHRPQSLSSTLEQLLAWEKRLYEDVKTREGVRIKRDKKQSTLQSQENKGEDQAKLDKTNASIKRLQSQFVVTCQAVLTTSTAIIRLRDSDLVPQLVQLCHGLTYMWRSMNQYHQTQNNKVEQVLDLMRGGTNGDSTYELHVWGARDLESAVTAWRSSFCRLIKVQRDFTRSLHDWFGHSLISVTIDNINGERETSDAHDFCNEWKLALERVPDTVASEVIKSLDNFLRAISVELTGELTMKKRIEIATKKLEKKASFLRNIGKFYSSCSMTGVRSSNVVPGNGQVCDACDPHAEKKSELAACPRRVGDESRRHSKTVVGARAKTLRDLLLNLQGVFKELTHFSDTYSKSLISIPMPLEDRACIACFSEVISNL